LADYLVGRATLNDIIEVEPRYGLRFITAGTSVPNPPDLLGSPKMRDLIQKLSEMFDLVLLDTPPLLIVSDSLVLARMVDKAVFVVRWVKTKRKSALLGIKQLFDANADVAGVVLSQVDIRRQSQYDADGYYRYHHYYTNTN
jgi:capsular exopolysaccharide synthesis family protein